MVNTVPRELLSFIKEVHQLLGVHEAGVGFCIFFLLSSCILLVIRYFVVAIFSQAQLSKQEKDRSEKSTDDEE
jgi:hypothetical protein